MSHLARLRRPAGAMGLSTLTVGLAILLQASWFFRQDVADVCERPAAIKHLAFGRGGEWALAAVLKYPANDHSAPRSGLWRCNLTGGSAELRELRLGVVPWRTACAAEGNVGFVATEGGRVYSVDMQGEQPVAKCLGRHPGHYARSLVSSRDGSRLVVAADSLAVWSYPEGDLLWERTDLQAADCCFAVGEERLYCCLAGGGILELNAATGVTLRSFLGQTPRVIKLTLSPDGTSLACMGLACYSLVDVRTGETRWQVACTAPLEPLFVGSRGELLLANLLAGPALSLVDSASGQTLAEYPVERDVSGLTAAGPDAVFTWSGTELRRLDLATGGSQPIARL